MPATARYANAWALPMKPVPMRPKPISRMSDVSLSKVRRCRWRLFTIVGSERVFLFPTYDNGDDGDLPCGPQPDRRKGWGRSACRARIFPKNTRIPSAEDDAVRACYAALAVDEAVSRPSILSCL